MTKERLLNGLLSLMIAAAMAVFGCRKKEPDAEPPTTAEQSAEQPAKQESQPKAEQSKPEEEKPFMEQMTQVEVAISATATKRMGMPPSVIAKNAQSVVIEEDADLVFPKEIGGFSLSYVGSPDIGGYVNDRNSKRPVSISYDSEELKSSVSIFIEQIPLEVTGFKMDLSSCQNRMQEMVKQVSMGKPPMAIYDKANESKIAQMFGNGNNMGINGFQINEPSPESKLETSSTPFRSVSWSWRIPNGRSRQYLIQDKGIHGAEMFWNIARRYGHTVGYLGQIDNPAAEQQYSLTSLLMLKNSSLITVIIQSEGGEAAENNAKAVEAFTASLDKDVLPSSCKGYYDRQDEKYEKSAWSTMGGKPLPFYAALKKDTPQDVISDCLSPLDMAGKSFGEICGVDYDTKLNYGRYDDSSRLADALQYLILYIKEYGTLPPSVRQPLEIVFKGANRHVDADALLAALGSKSEAKPEEAEALAAKERILRGKIQLRLRQVQRITRVIENDRQRRINALEREIDTKRTAKLEEYIQQIQSNASNQNFNPNTSEARKQVMDAINHVIDEFKSGKVSTRLNVTPPNQNNGGGFTLGSVLANFAGRFGMNTSSIQTELAKTAFDLGDDSFAISLLQFYGHNGFNADDLLSYMFSNGFSGFVDIYRGSSRDQQLWRSPRISHLMILSNYPIPGYILSNLITEGKIDIVRELLFADAPVNELSNGQLPLAIAIQSGNTELEQLLLANGAKKELKDGFGKTPEDYRIYGTFWKALNSKDYNTQKECLAKGMNVNQTTPNSPWRYIDIAIEKKDTEAVRMLLEAGADPAYNNIISRAYQSGQIEIFKLLLKHGAPLEQNGQHLLCTVLQPNYNSQGNATNFLKEVIAKMDKAKLNEEICKYNEQTRMTPACYAIFVANTGNDNASAQLLQKLRLLEEAGADIAKTPTPNSLPPLFFAVFKRHSTVDLYSYLLSKGADVNSVTVPKSTEISNNEWRLGNEISAKGVEKTGILTFAARHWAKTRYIDNNFLNNALPYLVEKGAKADVKDSYGKTAIDYLEELKGRNKHYAELLQTKFQTLGLIK